MGRDIGSQHRFDQPIVDERSFVRFRLKFITELLLVALLQSNITSRETLLGKLKCKLCENLSLNKDSIFLAEKFHLVTRYQEC